MFFNLNSVFRNCIQSLFFIKMSTSNKTSMYVCKRQFFSFQIIFLNRYTHDFLMYVHNPKINLQETYILVLVEACQRFGVTFVGERETETESCIDLVESRSGEFYSRTLFCQSKTPPPSPPHIMRGLNCLKSQLVETKCVY